MEDWARRQNIEHFERDLVTETDPARRRILEQLIGEERARLEEILRNKSPAPGAS